MHWTDFVWSFSLGMGVGSMIITEITKRTTDAARDAVNNLVRSNKLAVQVANEQGVLIQEQQEAARDMAEVIKNQRLRMREMYHQQAKLKKRLNDLDTDT